MDIVLNFLVGLPIHLVAVFMDVQKILIVDQTRYVCVVIRLASALPRHALEIPTAAQEISARVMMLAKGVVALVSLVIQMMMPAEMMLTVAQFHQ